MKTEDEAGNYLPPDIEEANERFGANCGPIALAAFSRRTVNEAMQFFGGSNWPGYTTATTMKRAIEAMGLTCFSIPGQWPRRGLVWVELVGPWSMPGIPIGAQLAKSHWIAKDGDNYYDCNEEGWLSYDGWVTFQARPWIARIKRATDWRVRTGIEVSQ
jgi:hypothetical protein